MQIPAYLREPTREPQGTSVLACREPWGSFRNHGYHAVPAPPVALIALTSGQRLIVVLIAFAFVGAVAIPAFLDRYVGSKQTDEDVAESRLRKELRRHDDQSETD